MPLHLVQPLPLHLVHPCSGSALDTPSSLNSITLGGGAFLINGGGGGCTIVNGGGGNDGGAFLGSGAAGAFSSSLCLCPIIVRLWPSMAHTASVPTCTDRLSKAKMNTTCVCVCICQSLSGS